MLKLKAKNRSLCLLQVYAPNAVNEYQDFVDDVNNALQKVGKKPVVMPFAGVCP